MSFVPSNKHPVVVLGAAGINGPRFCFCWVLRAALTEDGAYSNKYEIVLVECLRHSVVCIQFGFLVCLEE